MKVLNLDWNGFGEEGGCAMGCALKTCTLVELDLSNNRIGPEGFLNMIKSLKNNDDLKQLKVTLIVHTSLYFIHDIDNRLKMPRIQYPENFLNVTSYCVCIIFS